MANIRELGVQFIAKASGMRSSIQHVKKDVKGLRDTTQKSSKQMGQSWNTAADKLQNASKKMDGASKKVGGFGKKFTKVSGAVGGAATATSAAVFGLTNKIAENGNQIARSANQMGIGAEAYQELDYWASQNEVSQEQMEKAVGRLNQRMGKAANGNEKYASAMKRLGLNIEDVKDGTLSTEDAFTQSIQNLSEMDNQAEQAELATEMFGTKLARDLLPALQDGSLSIKEAREQAHKFGDVMSNDQVKASQEYEASMDKLQRSLKGVTQQIGVEFLPVAQKAIDYLIEKMPAIRKKVKSAFDKVSNTIKTIVDWFQSLSPELKKAAGLFSGIAAAIGPVSLALSGVMKFLSPAIDLFGKAFRVVGRFGGVMNLLKAAFVAISGPVGIAVASITAIVTAFTAAYNKSETFRNKVKQVIGVVKSMAMKIKPLIMQGVKAVVGFLKQIGSTLKTFWKQNGDTIIGAIKNIWGFAKPIIQKVFSLIKFVMPAILAIIKQVWGNIKGVIKGALNVIMGLVKTFAGLFTGNFSKMWEGVKQAFMGAIEFIWNFIQLQFIGKILKGAKALLSSFTGIIKSMWGGIKKTFMTVIKWIVGFVKRRFNAMKKTVGSIFNGIKKIAKTVWDKIKHFIISPIKSGVKWAIDKFHSFRSTVADIFGKIKNKVKDLAGGMIDHITSMPSKMKRGLKKGVKYVKEGMKAIGRGLVKPIEWAVNGVIKAINWVLKKFDADTISKWDAKDTLPFLYAKGTKGRGHPGGGAILGDGTGNNAGRELVQLPGGKSFLSEDRPTLYPDLPKGTKVTSAKQTRSLFPQYALGIGEWASDAWEGAKNLGHKAWEGTKKAGSAAWEGTKKAAGKLAEWTGNVWDYATHPGKLVGLAMDKFGPAMPDSIKMIGRVIKGGVNKLTDKAVGFVKGLFDKHDDPDVTGSARASDWESTIRKAAARMNVHPSQSEIDGIIAQIDRESGGNAGITQSSSVYDINIAQGNPARGLLQYIPETFNAYKVPGHNDIYSGWDQLLAFFNNTNWRHDLPYGRSGWGPSGASKYADGAFGIDTKQLAWIADGGWAESIISHDPSKRNSQKAIWERTGDALGFKDDQQNRRVLEELERIADAVERDKGYSFNIDSEKVAEMIEEPINRAQKEREIEEQRATGID